MGRKKMQTATSTVAEAVGFAYGELQELRDECREVYDNAQDHPGLAATSRVETMGETADILDGFCDDEPEVPEAVAELSVSYTIVADRRMSRADRRDNATAAMSIARDAVQGWLDEEDNDEHDDRDGAEQLSNKLDSDQNEAEGVEFPGMRG